MKKIWNVGIYARVSTDSESQETSVAEQIEIIKGWIKEKQNKNTEYIVIDTYIDNGVSGSTLNRGGIIKLLEDINNGFINMVITKDLSRLSRNYLQAGSLIEEVFIPKNIRYVATKDNIDTSKEIDDLMPFKNIMNEWFIKDCSKKIRDSLSSRMRRGSCISSKPPYGYQTQRIENDINTNKIILIPKGDQSTEVVKDIFSLYLKGYGYGKIASYLNDKGIKPPSAHLKNFPNSKFGLWNNNTVKSILTNPKYGGYMIQGQFKKLSYKNKKVIKVNKEEWINGGNFEGIIDKETFNLVQETIKQRGEKNYRYKNKTIHPFSSVLKCTGCGGAMSYRAKYKGYKCTNSQTGKQRCTAHSVKEDDLILFLKKTLREEVYKIDRNKYYKCENVVIIDSRETELKSLKKELDILDKKMSMVYDDRFNNILKEDNYKKIVESIQRQQEKLLKRKEELEYSMQNNKEINIYEMYKKEIDKLLNFDEIDRTVVEKLVDRIEVTEIKGTGEKKVDFYLKFKKNN